MNMVEITTISRNGANHAALRRRSVKVFEGAMKVLRMRAPSESGADSGAEMEGDTGESGAAAMVNLLENRRTNTRRNSSMECTARQAKRELGSMYAKRDADGDCRAGGGVGCGGCIWFRERANRARFGTSACDPAHRLASAAGHALCAGFDFATCISVEMGRSLCRAAGGHCVAADAGSGGGSDAAWRLARLGHSCCPRIGGRSALV